MTELYSDEAALRLFECDIDRSRTKLPDNYLPDAPGVLIAGKDMLRAAGYVPRSYHPHGWTPGEPGTFLRRHSPHSGHKLWVRKCGKFWIIERSMDLNAGHRRDIEALIFASGLRPICTRTYKAAMWLAEHCDPIPCAPLAGHWVGVCLVRMVDGLFVSTQH
jgi:hypothetical protein